MSKNLIQLYLCFSLLLSVSAQTHQLLNGGANKFGFVNATRNVFYTYNDINKDKPNPPINFELKRFNPATNTFSIHHSVVNTNQYVKYFPLAMINGKYLAAADYYTNFGAVTFRNFFVYDGNQYDSIFSQGMLTYYGNTNLYSDTLNQKVYFTVDSISSLSGVYVSDFTKSGTNRLCSFQNNLGQRLYGNGPNVYFTDVNFKANSGLTNKLYQVTQNGKVPIDSAMGLSLHIDNISNELFVYKYGNNSNNLYKINLQNQKIVLNNAPTNSRIFFGKVKNKLVFLNSTGYGLLLYDLNTQTTSTIFKQGTTNEPSLISQGFNAGSFITPTYNHMYLKIGDSLSNKIWVTDGNSINELDHLQYASLDSFNLSRTFCGENWIVKQKSSSNQSKMVSYDALTNSNNICFQSSTPSFNCVYSSAYMLKNHLYVLSENNLYEVTNCGIGSTISDLQKSINEIDFYFAENTVKFTELHERFSGCILQLKSMEGKIVYKTKLERNKYDYFLNTKLSKGFYFLEVVYEGNSIKRKKIASITE